MRFSVLIPLLIFISFGLAAPAALEEKATSTPVSISVADKTAVDTPFSSSGVVLKLNPSVNATIKASVPYGNNKVNLGNQSSPRNEQDIKDPSRNWLRDGIDPDFDPTVALILRSQPRSIHSRDTPDHVPLTLEAYASNPPPELACGNMFFENRHSESPSWKRSTSLRWLMKLFF